MGADKTYDVAEFVDALRDGAVTLHVPFDGHVRKTGKPRRTVVNRRTACLSGYVTSANGLRSMIAPEPKSVSTQVPCGGIIAISRWHSPAVAFEPK